MGSSSSSSSVPSNESLFLVESNMSAFFLFLSGVDVSEDVVTITSFVCDSCFSFAFVDLPNNMLSNKFDMSSWVGAAGNAAGSTDDDDDDDDADDFFLE